MKILHTGIAISIYSIFIAGYYTASKNNIKNGIWDSIPSNIDTDMVIINDRRKNRYGLAYFSYVVLNNKVYCNAIKLPEFKDISDEDLDLINKEIKDIYNIDVSTDMEKYLSDIDLLVKNEQPVV